MAENVELKTHLFYSPTKIIIGMDTTSLVPEEIQNLGGGRVLIVTDPGVLRAGLLEPVVDLLKSQNIDYALYDKVEPEPPSGVIDRGAETFQTKKCALIIGFGGGSSLDVAKGISIMTANPGNILDYCGVDQVPQKGAPLILMPTTAGTGSEVTRVLVLTDEGQNMKNAVFTPHALANVAIIDPNLTLTLPEHITADTGVDALVHAIESYVSMNTTVFSDILSERAIKLIARHLPAARAKGTNQKARYHMSLAATLAGLAFGSGGLGAVHALAYPLGTEYHMTHGRSNAIMLPHVMQYNLPGNAEKYARIAELLGHAIAGCSPLKAGDIAVEAVKEILTAVGVSYRLRDYGIPHEDLSKLVEGSLKQFRLFVPNPRDLAKTDLQSIYNAAY